MVVRGELGRLLVEAFPVWEELGQECEVRRAIQLDPGNFSDAIKAVTRGSGRDSLMSRIRSEHPTSAAHLDQHDDRLRDALSEAVAFAWASEVAKLGQPRFIGEEGAPDLQAGEWWIEAKNVWESVEERRQQNRGLDLFDRGDFLLRVAHRGPPGAGLIQKFDQKLKDALQKWHRQSRTGKLAVFFALNDLDFDVSPRQARRAITAWASRAESRSGARIVVCDYDNWQQPLYPASPASAT